MREVFILFAVVCLLQAVSSQQVLILANSIDLELAGDYVKALEDAGVDVTVVQAQEFPQYREEKIIFILGGHHAPEGVGSIVDGILSEEDKGYLLSSPESRDVFVFHNTWSSNQTVLVFAGYEKEQTRQILGETRTGMPELLRSGALDYVFLSYPSLDQNRNFTEVDVYQASAIIQSTPGVIIVDVRASPYYEEGHLPGAINLPEEEIAERWSELSPEETYLLYCGGNSQSINVGNILYGKGFSRLYRMVDGYAAWRRAGYLREKNGSL